jgi:hypothetical protein
MEKVYLDWNVFTNLQSRNSLSNLEDKKKFENLDALLFAHKDEIAIPYSNAHLKDLLRGYSEDTITMVKNSLDFLSSITNNFSLVQYWNEEQAMWHFRDPHEFFESLLNELPFQEYGSFENFVKMFDGIEKMFEPFKLQLHNIDFGQMQSQNPFFASLFPKAQKENSAYAMIEDIYNLFQTMFANPTVYMELRKMFKTGIGLDSNISNYENVVQQLDGTLSKSMLKKSFKELLDVNKDKHSKNENYSKILSVYMQLDFVGYRSDKLSEKNQYDNLFNDALHCFYAAHCDYFITSDKKSYLKSKAVYQAEGINTSVMTPGEFVEKFKLSTLEV